MAAVVFVLLLVPLIIEGVALHPERFAGYGDPLFAGVRLLLVQLVPYWIAALSVAVWAFLLSRSSVEVTPVRRMPVASTGIGILALALAALAAFPGFTLHDVLLHDAAFLRAGGIQMGRGGPLAARYALESVPLEEADLLAHTVVEPTDGGEAVVCWVGSRGPETATRRAELVVGGTAHEVTGDYLSLEAGSYRLFSKRVAVGPHPTSVRLRLSDDPAQPAVFLNRKRAAQNRGVALDAGGGDVAFRSAGGTPRSGLNGRRGLLIEGQHRTGGYTVLVLSGEEWRQHDLRSLFRTGGRIELHTEQSQPLDWEVCLVGGASESGAIPLREFEHRPHPDGGSMFSLDLAEIDPRDVPLSNVVGIALRYTGDPGPFRLELVEARVVPPDAKPSGFGVGATAALDPGSPPRDALLAAGDPETGEWLARNLSFVRLAAAFLLTVAVLGPPAFLRAILAAPSAFLLAALAGPALTALYDAALPYVLVPRLEHVPLLVGLSAASTAVLVRRPRRAPSAGSDDSLLRESRPSAQGRLAWLDALKGLAILGVIGIHVTADSAGLPFQAAAADERLLPMVARAVFTGLNYPVFLIASFYLLAHTLEQQPRSYGEVIRSRFHRLAVPLVIWTIVYVVLRCGKAMAFGYHEAYRRELASGATWLEYLFLGSGQYHLHFLPLLFGLTLLYPLFRPAARRPWLCVLLLGTLFAWPWLDGIVYARIPSPEVRQYVLRGTKTFAYMGYGLLAFALYGLRSRGLDRNGRRALLAVALLTGTISLVLLLRHAFDTAYAGRWLPLSPAAHMARYLLPAAVFTLFFLGEGGRFPRWMVAGGVFCMGLYLVHPVFLDLLEILERGASWPPALTVGVNLVAVTLLASLAVLWMRRSPRLAGLLGVPVRRR